MRKIMIFSILLLTGLQIYAQGCMDASSEEGVNVVGYLQTQYQYQFKAEEDSTRFYFNRARMGLVGNIPYDFSYYAMFEFSPSKVGAPYLLDGFITYSRFAPFTKLSMGRFKSPLSLELNTPCQGLHTINRSLVVNELTIPGRDIGLMMNGKIKEMMNYSFALTNGTGVSNLYNTQNKTLTGRLTIDPIEMISLGGSFKYASTLDTLMEKQDYYRYAGEFQFKHSNILVQGEYLYGKGFVPETPESASSSDGDGDGG